MLRRRESRHLSAALDGGTEGGGGVALGEGGREGEVRGYAVAVLGCAWLGCAWLCITSLLATKTRSSCST